MQILITDTETTDKNPLQCEVLACAWLTVDEQLKIMDAQVRYFWQPHFRINPEAEAIHGLTAEMLMPYVDKYYQQLQEMYPIFNKGIMLAHNISYDSAVVQYMFNRAGYQCDLTQKLCSMKGTKYEVKAKDKRGSTKNPNLMEMLAYYGISEETVTKFDRQTFGEPLSKVQHHSASWDASAVYLAMVFGALEGMKRAGEWF